MPKILVIDDQQETLITIADILETMIPNCKVISSLSGKDGMKKAKEEQPDVIILDIVMPEMDGFEVCQKLKADNETINIPIILITGIKADTDNRVKGLELGADVFLSKPVNQSELTAQTNVMLRIKAAEDKLRDDKVNLEELVQEKTKEQVEINKKLRLEITERKQAEQQYKDLVEKAGIAILIDDLDGNFTFFNQRFNEIFGYSSKEIKKKSIQELVHPEDVAEVVQHHNNRMTGKPAPSRYEFRGVKKDGLVIHLETDVVPLNEGNSTIGTRSYLWDITERKQAEEALQSSEAVFKSVFSQAPVGIELYDSKGNLISVNQECLNIFGVTHVDEIKGFKLFEDPNISKEAKTQLRNSEPVDYESKFDFEIVKKLKLYKTTRSGKCFLHVQITPYEISDCGEKGFVVHVQDITEVKQAEEELRLHSQIISNMTEGVYLIRAEDGIIVYTNPAFEIMFGYGPDEMIGKHVSTVNAPTDKDPEEIAGEIIEILDKTGKWQGEIINKRKDGTTFWCYAHVSIFNHPLHGKVWITVHTDITKRKQAEEELEKHRDHLEKLVKERTAELEKKNAELKRYNKLFVGREFRIKELRDKVKELENRLKKNRGK